MLFAGSARPLRFAVTGGLAALVQLILLALLTRAGWPGLGGNVVAFILAAQVNFALSTTYTWRDRAQDGPLWRLWALFHISIAGMAMVNMTVFAVVEHVMPALVASMLGIGVAAIGNFIVGDRLVFRARRAEPRLLRKVA